MAAKKLDDSAPRGFRLLLQRVMTGVLENDTGHVLGEETDAVGDGGAKAKRPPSASTGAAT